MLQIFLHAEDHTSTYVRVWLGLLALTGLLVLVSRLGQGFATLGLLTLTPLKAGLVLYFFMHLKDERRSLILTLVPATIYVLAMMNMLFPDGIRLHLMKPPLH